MPKIQGYEQQIAPGGFLGAQASPAAFGSQIGEAAVNFGSNIGEVGRGMQAVEEERDVSEVQKAAFRARLSASKALEIAKDKSGPMDTKFAEDFTAQVPELVASTYTPTTRRGKQLFEQQAVGITTDFGMRAQAVQGELAAKHAMNHVTKILDISTQTVNDDISQFGSVEEGIKNLRYGGPISLLDQADQDKLIHHMLNAVSLAAAKKYAGTKDGAEAFTASINPEAAKRFNLARSVVEKHMPAGRTLKVSAETESQLPEIGKVSKDYDLNPALVAGLVETRGQDAKLSAATLAPLLEGFKGDEQKALAAIFAGKDAVTQAEYKYGTMWLEDLPAEAKAQVERVQSISVGSNAPMAEPGVSPEPAAPQAPEPSPFPFMKYLSGSQQQGIAQEAVQTLDLLDRMALREERQIAQAKEKLSQSKVNYWYQKVSEGGFNWKEVNADPDINADHKQWLYGVWKGRLDEARYRRQNMDDSGQFVSLFSDIKKNKINDPDILLGKFTGGVITWQSYNILRKELQDRREGTLSPARKQFDGYMDGIEKVFTSSISQISDKLKGIATYKYALWVRSARDKWHALEANNEDPAQMLDPKNSHFIGNPATLNEFLTPRNITEAVAQAASAGGGSPMAPPPGATPTPPPPVKRPKDVIIWEGKKLKYKGTGARNDPKNYTDYVEVKP